MQCLGIQLPSPPISYRSPDCKRQNYYKFNAPCKLNAVTFSKQIVYDSVSKGSAAVRGYSRRAKGVPTSKRVGTR